MRCFIAIELPADIKENLFNLEKEIGNDYAKIKWIAKKNLHISLKFLGEVDEEKLKLTREALSYVKEKKFVAELGELSWFSSKDDARVIWVGVKPENKIFDLYGEVELKLGSLFKKDERFTVHLTLGRVKFIKNKEEFLSILKNTKVKTQSFIIDNFCLVRSYLSKDGPTYTILEKYALE